MKVRCSVYDAGMERCQQEKKKKGCLTICTGQKSRKFRTVKEMEKRSYILYNTMQCNTMQCNAIPLYYDTSLDLRCVFKDVIAPNFLLFGYFYYLDIFKSLLTGLDFQLYIDHYHHLLMVQLLRSSSDNSLHFWIVQFYK